jgi:hypothetical protein
MQPNSSLLCSEEPAPGPYFKLNEFSSHFPTCFFNIHFHIIFPCVSWSSIWSLSFMFADQNFVCIYSFPYMLHVHTFNLLHLIILIMFVKKYKLWSSSLHNFTQSLKYLSSCKYSLAFCLNHVCGVCVADYFYEYVIRNLTVMIMKYVYSNIEEIKLFF